jgi:hypothetical protein
MTKDQFWRRYISVAGNGPTFVLLLTKLHTVTSVACYRDLIIVGFASDCGSGYKNYAVDCCLHFFVVH